MPIGNLRKWLQKKVLSDKEVSWILRSLNILKVLKRGSNSGR